MKVIEIKKNQSRYINQVIDLEKEAFGENGGVDIWILKPLVKYGKVLAMLDEEAKVVGVAEFIRAFDQAEAYLYGFAVAKSQRGKGVGNKFLKAVIDDMEKRGIKKISLTVNPENVAAISLYEKNDFERVELLKDEYGLGVDRVYMEYKVEV